MSNREVTVTVKNGKGFEDPWEVFHGDPQEVRQDMIDWFGMDPESVERLPGHQVLTLANKIAHGEHIVATVLGGVPVEVETGSKAASKPEPKPEPEPEGPDYSALIEQISSASDMTALKKLWVKHKPAFAEQAVKDAYTARGKALKAA